MKKVLLALVALLATFSQSQAEKSLEYYLAQPEEEIYKLPKPLVRQIEFMRRRAYPNGVPSRELRVKAINETNKMIHQGKSQAALAAAQPQWRNIGPFNVGGRIKSVVCHPTQHGTVYIAAAAGGIWKTTNRGNDWTPIFDDENSIAFGSIAIDWNNPDVLYAGTGESVVGGGNVYLGGGMYKTTDAGETWDLIGLSKVGAFSRVWVHPLDSDLIFAGATSPYAGFYRSTDGGETWEQTFEGSVTDVTIDPNDKNELLIGVSAGGVYFSADMGETWTERNYGFRPNIGRVSVQMAPSDPNRVYALMENNGVGNIYISNNKSESWNLVFVGESSFFNGQGFYNNHLVIHPTDKDIAFAGGIDLWKTDNGGSVWINVTYGYEGGEVHVDQHAGCFDPTNPDYLYIGNDGGMYLSSNTGEHWNDINNNLEVTQFYEIGIDHGVDNRTYGGTQDNGTLGNRNSEDSWAHILGGDGFEVIVDYKNSNIVYCESQYGNMYRIDYDKNRYYSIQSGIPGDDSRGIWNSPMELSPSDNYILYHGRYRAYISYDQGDYWEALTPNKFNARFTSIECSPHPDGDEIVYFGNEVGKILVSTDEGWFPYDVSNGLTNRYVTEIAASPHELETAYATFSGYGNPHVFKTTNLGDSWTDISENLPDVPCNSIAIHPNIPQYLYVGTDVGVFASFDGGNLWTPYGRGLSRSPVNALEITEKSNGDIVLRAATHGRSMWEVDLLDEAITTPEITTPTGGEVYVGTTSQIISWHGFTEPVKVEFYDENNLDWTTLAAGAVGGAMRWTVPNRDTYVAQIKISSETAPDEIVTSNLFTIEVKDKGAVLRSGGVNHVPYGICYDGKNGLWTTALDGNRLYKLDAKTLVVLKSFEMPADSLFTDLTLDRERGIFYVHKLNSTGSSGGTMYVVDTTGAFIDQMSTPATRYPIGLELVGNNLIVGDRDGQQKLWIINPETGDVIESFDNPYSYTYGPRGLCYDGGEYLYQVCTYFPGGGVLTEAYVIRIPIDNMDAEHDRLPLQDRDGLINGRGVEFDPSDKNMWLSDYGGTIYKMAGFHTILSAEESPYGQYATEKIDARIYPNPMTDFSNISFTAPKASRVRIDIYDVYGRVVRTLFDADCAAGQAEVATLERGQLPAGAYYASFVVDGEKAVTKQFVILK